MNSIRRRLYYDFEGDLLRQLHRTPVSHIDTMPPDAFDSMSWTRTAVAQDLHVLTAY